jgi:hypothetical protein
MTDASATTRFTKYQKFRPQRVERRQLMNAPYNPRQALHPELAQRLRDNLERVGLVEPLTWNKTTGNLLAGHQRLAALDVLHGNADYKLDVAAVELSCKVEREQNVFLNNPAVQGDWDMVALSSLFKQPGFDVTGAGFADVDVLDIFGEQIFVDIFGADALQAEALAQEEAVAQAALPTAEKPRRAGSPSSAASAAGADADAPLESDVLLILFASRTDRERFMTEMGCDPDERYIDAARVLGELGVDTREGWARAFAP